VKLKKILIVNRAPFERLELDFEDVNVVVLSGINGTGKTTILSYIVDSFYELAKKVFNNEFFNKENKYYRLSSDLYSMDMDKASVVYFRFVDGTDICDYVDFRGNSKEEYDEILKNIDNKIPFSKIQSAINNRGNVKEWSINDDKKIEKIFNEKILTYFPAYRYEQPSYLNDPYKIELKFKTDSDFSGYLKNPIEVTSDLQNISNWIMDVILDTELYKTHILFDQLNSILQQMLNLSKGQNVRFGIGTRNLGATRIAVMNRDNDKRLYPSIFSMSSGELALLCLFGEILKQSDKINKVMKDVLGIVLVDEIDKHLHIKLQKEVLPKLIRMFPNIQFIVSSHSPFFSLGLGEEQVQKYKIYDLDNNGILCSSQDTELFKEVYDMMIKQNEDFKRRCDELNEKIKDTVKPLIITEGKTDWKHIKAAMTELNINDIDINFYESEDPFGDNELLKFLERFKINPFPNKIIGIFDRDNFDKLNDKEISRNLEEKKYIKLANNVFAFAIPLVHQDIYETKKISIEHYYIKNDLTKEYNGRRLFLGNEFNSNGISPDGQYQTRIKEIQNKVKINGIIDEKVFKYEDLKNGKEINNENSIALSKANFAQMILDKNDFAKGFDFSSFKEIFAVIKEILTK